MKVKSLSLVQLSDPTDCSLPGSSIHGIFQARVLEWGAIAFSIITRYNVAILPLLTFSVFDLIYEKMGFPGSTASESLQCRRPQFDSWVRKIPWRRDRLPLQYPQASLVAQMVKNLPAMQETWVSSLAWEDPLEEAPTPVFLPGEGPWTEEPGGLQSMGTQRIGQD